MKPSERRAALSRLNEDGLFHTGETKSATWKIVSKWIRQMVKIEPKIMREVSKATFGNLGSWFEKGEGNVKACGCLVGTVALEMTKTRNHFKIQPGKLTDDKPSLVCTTNEFKDGYDYHAKGDAVGPWEVVEFLAQKSFTAHMKQEAEDAGCAASSLGIHLGQDTAVALIKDEIVKALKVRATKIKRARLVRV